MHDTFKEQLEELIEKELYTQNATGRWVWRPYTCLSDESLRWIVEECPTWDYLDRTDDNGNSLYSVAVERGMIQPEED